MNDNKITEQDVEDSPELDFLLIIEDNSELKKQLEEKQKLLDDLAQYLNIIELLNGDINKTNEFLKYELEKKQKERGSNSA